MEGKTKTEEKNAKLLLYGLISISLFVIFHKIILGGYDFLYYDVGSDTSNLYYPIYLEIIRKIKTLDFSVWTFGHGLGNSLLNYQAVTCDPFTYVIVLLGIILGDGIVGRAIGIVFCIKVYIIGAIAYRWLGCFGINKKIKVFAAYLIAFSSYMFIWGGHCFFGTACVFIVIAYYLIEKTYISGKGYVWISVYVAATILLNFYLSYMIVISMSLYLLIRYLYTKEKIYPKVLIKDVLSYIGFVVLGYGIGAFLLLPNLNNLFNTSSRLEGASSSSILSTIGSTLIAPYDKDYYACMLGRLFGNNFIGEASGFPYLNYYEAIQISLSVLVLIALPQVVSMFVLKKGMTPRKRIIALIGTALPVYLIVFQFGGCMYNGFQYSMTRFTFAVMPLMGLLVAYYMQKMMEDCHSGSVVVLLITVVVSSWLIHKLTNKYTIDKSGFYYAIVLIAMIVCFLAILVYRYKGSMVWLYIIIGCCIVQITCDNYITINNRGMYSRISESYSLKEDTDAAIEYLQSYDDSFYRIGKTYNCFSYNDGLVSGYNGISEYNSTGNRFVWDYIVESCEEANKWTGMVFDFNNIEDAYELLGVKYILTISEIDSLDWEFINNINGVVMYQNMRYNGNCVVADDKNYYILKDDFEEAGELKKINSGNLKIKVNAHEGQVLATSIPYEEGWNVYVNGKKAEIERSNVGYVSVMLEEGENEIEFKYITKYLLQGMCVTFISIIVWINIFALYKRREERNDKF